MKKTTNNNYFAEIKTLMPDKEILEKFADTNSFAQVYTNGATPPSILKTTGGNFIAEIHGATLPKGYLFPPQGGWHAGSKFNPEAKTTTGKAGVGSSKDKGLDKDQIGWICSVNDPKNPIFNDKGAVVPANLDKAKKAYQNMRNGKSTGITNLNQKEINSVILKLSNEKSLYCDPTKQTKEGMGDGNGNAFVPFVPDKNSTTSVADQVQKNNKNYVKAGKLKSGFELGCTDSFGSYIPNCACDPNCFPGVLGGIAKTDSSGTYKIVAMGPCAPPASGAKGGTLYTVGTPQCGSSAGGPEPPTKQCYNSSGVPTGPIPPSGKCPAPKPGGSSEAPSQCPAPHFPANPVNPAASIAEAMGMNQKCQMSAETTAASGEISGSMSFLFVHASIGGSFTSSSSSNTSSGCGQRMMDLMSDSTNISNLQCNINNASAKVGVKIDSNASINITYEQPTRQQTEALESEIKNANDNYTAAFGMAIKYTNGKPNANLTRTLKIMQEGIDQLQAQQQASLSGNTFTATSSMTISAISKATIKTSQQMIATTCLNIKEQARTKIKNMTGVGAGPEAPNINELIDQQISNNLSNISDQISTAIASTNVEGKDPSSVNLKVPWNANITGNTFAATSKVDISAEAISQIVSQQASKIASQIIGDASGDQDSDSTDAGLAALEEALGKANEDGNPLKWQGIAAIVGGIVGAIIIIVLIFFMFKPSKPGEGPSIASGLANKAMNAKAAGMKRGKFGL